MAENKYDSSLYSGSDKLLSCFLGSTSDSNYSDIDDSRATPEERARSNIGHAVAEIGNALEGDEWETIEENLKDLVSHYDPYKKILRGLPSNWYVAVYKVIDSVKQMTRAQLKEFSRGQRAAFSRVTDYLSLENIHPFKDLNKKREYSELYDEIISNNSLYETEILAASAESAEAAEQEEAGSTGEEEVIEEGPIRSDSIVVSRIFEFFKITFDEEVEEESEEEMGPYIDRTVISPYALLQEAKSVVSSSEITAISTDELHDLCCRCLSPKAVLHVILALVESIIERGAVTSEARNIACCWLMLAARIAVANNITEKACVEDLVADKVIPPKATELFSTFSRSPFVSRIQSSANALSRFSVKSVPILLFSVILADYFRIRTVVTRNLISQLAAGLAKEIYHVTDISDLSMFMSDISREPLLPSFASEQQQQVTKKDNNSKKADDDDDAEEESIEMVLPEVNPVSPFPSKDYNTALANELNKRYDVFFSLRPDQRMEYLTQLVINPYASADNGVSLINHASISNFEKINADFERLQTQMSAQFAAEFKNREMERKRAAEEAMKKAQAASEPTEKVNENAKSDSNTGAEENNAIVANDDEVITEKVEDSDEKQATAEPNEEAAVATTAVEEQPKKVEIKKYYIVAHENYPELVNISQTIISEPKPSNEAIRGDAETFVKHFFESGVAPARFSCATDLKTYVNAFKSIVSAPLPSLIECDAINHTDRAHSRAEGSELKSQMLLRYAYSLAINGDWMRALSIIALNPQEVLVLLKLIGLVEAMERTNQQNKILAQKLELMIIPPYPPNNKTNICKCNIISSSHYLFYRAIAQIGLSAFADGDIIIAQTLLKLVSDIVLSKHQHRNKITCTRQRFIPDSVHNSIANSQTGYNQQQNIPALIAAYLSSEEDKGSCPSGEVVDMVLYVSVVLSTAAELSKSNSLQGFLIHQKITVRKVLAALSQGSMNVSPKYIAAMLLNSLLKFKIDDLKKVGEIILDRAPAVFREVIRNNIVNKVFRVASLDCFFAGVKRYMSEINYKKLARQFQLDEDFIRYRYE